MAEGEKRIEKGEYVIGIAVILAALLLCVTLYTGAGGLQNAILGIKAGTPAAAGSGTGTGTPLGTAATIDKTKIEKFLNSNFLAQQGLSAKVTGVEAYNSYLSTVTVSIMNGTTELQSGLVFYATNDAGTLVMGGQVYGTNETLPTATDTNTNAAPAAQPAPKTDTPVAKGFVMAYCPYGLQFLKAYIPVIELLGNTTDVQVGFVSYAMHGKSEIEANSYIYCVQKDSKAKLASYLRCFVESGNYTACLAAVGIDANQAASCVNALDTQYGITALYNNQSTWLSGYYPQYPVEASENAQFGVQGSPTFVLNGAVATVQRTSESIKQAICASFNTPPAECNTTLSATAEAAGLGAVGSSAGAPGSATAGCGS